MLKVTMNLSIVVPPRGALARNHMTAQSSGAKVIAIAQDITVAPRYLRTNSARLELVAAEEDNSEEDGQADENGVHEYQCPYGQPPVRRHALR
jgi:hypothetical protein